MKVCNLLLVLAATTPALSHAADGFFVDGSLGRASNTAGQSESTVSALVVGYRWSWFGLDVGYVDLSRANSPVYEITDGTFLPKFFRYGSKENGTTFDVSGRWNIGEHWYCSARAGLYAWHNTFYLNDYEPIASRSRSTQSAVSWNAGVGVGYNFNDNFSVGLRYDAYHGDEQTATPLSLTSELRF